MYMYYDTSLGCKSYIGGDKIGEIPVYSDIIEGGVLWSRWLYHWYLQWSKCTLCLYSPLIYTLYILIQYSDMYKYTLYYVIVDYSVHVHVYRLFPFPPPSQPGGECTISHTVTLDLSQYADGSTPAGANHTHWLHPTLKPHPH